MGSKSPGRRNAHTRTQDMDDPRSNFLASGDASFVTGQGIAVDGGHASGRRVGFTELMRLE